MPDDTAETVDGDHGRIETRRATVLHDIGWLAERHGFPGLTAVGEVEATREIDGKTTTANRYGVLGKPLSAAHLLDVVRARKDNAPENLARLRRFALNILRANQDKSSTRRKIKRAASDDACLLKLLAAA